MAWATELLRSSVLAAVITAVVAAIGFYVSSATARRINRDKLELDRELAESKARAELALAERKAALDKGVTLAKRRAEVAEKVLADFYEIRRAFDVIRSPMIWAEEMQSEDGVAEDIISNDGFNVRRRMRQYSDLFSRLDATRFAFGALFGHTATDAYMKLVRVHNRVFEAAGDLLRYRGQEEDGNLREHLRKMRRVAFSMTHYDDEGQEVADTIKSELDEIIAEIEALCRPALEASSA